MNRMPGNRYQGWTSDGYEILNGDGNVVARCTEWDFEDQDAAYIVRAVNCHERLVEMVRDYRKLALSVSEFRTFADKAQEIDLLLAEAEGGR